MSPEKDAQDSAAVVVAAAVKVATANGGGGGDKGESGRSSANNAAPTKATADPTDSVEAVATKKRARPQATAGDEHDVQNDSAPHADTTSATAAAAVTATTTPIKAEQKVEKVTNTNTSAMAATATTTGATTAPPAATGTPEQGVSSSSSPNKQQQQQQLQQQQQQLQQQQQQMLQQQQGYGGMGGMNMNMPPGLMGGGGFYAPHPMFMGRPVPFASPAHFMQHPGALGMQQQQPQQQEQQPQQPMTASNKSPTTATTTATTTDTTITPTAGAATTAEGGSSATPTDPKENETSIPKAVNGGDDDTQGVVETQAPTPASGNANDADAADSATVATTPTTTQIPTTATTPSSTAAAGEQTQSNPQQQQPLMLFPQMAQNANSPGGTPGGSSGNANAANNGTGGQQQGQQQAQQQMQPMFFPPPGMFMNPRGQVGGFPMGMPVQGYPPHFHPAAHAAAMNMQSMNPMHMQNMQNLQQNASGGAGGGQTPGGAGTPTGNIPGMHMNMGGMSMNMAGMVGLPVVVSAGISLALACDVEQLSEYQIMVRQQLEIFQAGPEDVECNTQGRKKQVCLGQVGIRCRHCAGFPLRVRGRGAVYYPAKLDGIYQAAQNMAGSHLCQACQQIPVALKQQIRKLRERRDNASGGKQYWADGCRALGLYETEEGLRIKHQQPSMP